MDHLWSPWRYSYVSSVPAKPPSPEACLFCRTAAAVDTADVIDTAAVTNDAGRDHSIHSQSQRDAENLVVLRAEKSFILLNAYPYTSGHIMIAPYAHVATLAGAETSTLEEIMRLAQWAEKGLRSVYRAEGFNIGFNVGQCAGAGFAGHIHLHLLPRWCGDTNFMTTIGETRVLPEDLAVTYAKLSAVLKDYR